MNDHGYVWNKSMIIHYHLECLVQLWLRQTEHIHDHSLPHRILGSNMTTTNKTYPMNDHGYISCVVVKVEPSILCGNEWSWICFVCPTHSWTKYFHYHTEYLVETWLRQTEHIHDHSLPHRILGSPMITTNETYPWSFITTQNTCRNQVWTKYSVW
jgi:hypothetical protein